MSLEPAKHNFTILQGATFYKRIFWDVEGTPEDLTGFEASLLIKDKPDGTVLLSLNSEPEGGIVLGGKEGTISLTIPAAETAGLTWDVGRYELFVTNTINQTDILIRGSFKVIPF